MLQLIRISATLRFSTLSELRYLRVGTIKLNRLRCISTLLLEPISAQNFSLEFLSLGFYCFLMQIQNVTGNLEPDFQFFKTKFVLFAGIYMQISSQMLRWVFCLRDHKVMYFHLMRQWSGADLRTDETVKLNQFSVL